MWNSQKQIQNEQVEKIKALTNTLKICHHALCTYGKHPIIDSQVNEVLKR